MLTTNITKYRMYHVKAVVQVENAFLSAKQNKNRRTIFSHLCLMLRSLITLHQYGRPLRSLNKYIT